MDIAIHTDSFIPCCPSSLVAPSLTCTNWQRLKPSSLKRLRPRLRLGDLVNDGRLVPIVGMCALVLACGTAARGVHALKGRTLLDFGHGSDLLGVLERSLTRSAK